MSVAALLCVTLVSIIQSLFGVGVLLFGTPLLLLLGYKFVDTLLILLPISVSINLLQVLKHHVHIDTGFYKRILLYTIPFVVLCLFLVTRTRINIDPIIGLFLVFVALKAVSAPIERLVGRLVHHERTYLAITGIVHGLLNLGGSLLIALVHSKGHEKDVTRVTIAAAYATFALFQILTLMLSLRQIDLPFSTNALYLGAGVLAFALTERFIYAKLDSARYSRIFAGFLFVSGLLLVGRSVLF